jgi:hypothetical protein
VKHIEILSKLSVAMNIETLPQDAINIAIKINWKETSSGLKAEKQIFILRKQ